jgi:hypothetical protein
VSDTVELRLSAEHSLSLHRQDRLFNGYKKLIEYVPLVKGALEGENLNEFFKNVCSCLIRANCTP